MGAGGDVVDHESRVFCAVLVHFHDHGCGDDLD